MNVQNEPVSALELLKESVICVKNQDYARALELYHQTYCIKFSEHMSCQRELRELNQKPKFERIFYQTTIAKLEDRTRELTETLEGFIEYSNNIRDLMDLVEYFGGNEQ